MTRQIPSLTDNGLFPLPQLYLGGAALGLPYASHELLLTDEPERVLLAGFRAGMTAFDTSPYYEKSEELIGRILSQPDFAAEFPRRRELLCSASPCTTSEWNAQLVQSNHQSWTLWSGAREI